MNPARALSDAEIEAALTAWRDDGYAVIRQVADATTVGALRDRLQAYLLGERPDPGLFFQRDSGTGSYADVTFGHGWEGPDVPYRKVERLERDDRFAAWLGDPLFRRMASRIFPGGTSLYRATAFLKAPRVGSDLPWHQDGGLFWGLDRTPCWQVWTALDDAPVEAGCLEVVPGSHRAGLVTPNGGLVPAAKAAGVAGVKLPASAGDVVLLHNLLWHRSGPNPTASPRRAFTVSYLDAATRCTRTRRAPRVFTTVF